MLTLFRWLVRLSVVLIAGAVLVVGLVWYFSIRSLPDYNADYTVAGLAAPVEIVRSTENVPHIFGSNDADLFLALGLAHAQDRLFQMTVLRRAADGRLSELYGARAYAADDLARRLGLARRAKESLAAQDDYTRAALTAYAEGVNQWIQIVNREARGRGAPEFFLYPEDIAYWQAADSLAILKLLASGSTAALRNEVLRARLSLALPRRGPQVVSQAGEADLPDYASLFPGGRLAAPGTAPAPEDDWFNWRAGFVAPAAERPASGAVFAADAARTAAGGALLADAIDTGLTAPSLFYLARLELASGGVIGATIPGVPVVLSGRSATLAWGIAPAQIDDQDVLVEEVQPGDSERYRDLDGWRAFDTRREVIRVRGDDDQVLTLRESVNGPIIPAGHLGLAGVLPAGHVAALSWTGLSTTDTTMSALMGLMRAPDRAAAGKALQGIVAPAVEVSLADAGGVTRQLAGARPVRSESHATHGRMPAPGWIAANRWQGVLPPEAPQDVAGQIVAATGETGAAPGPDAPRAARLQALLSSREVHSRDSFIDAQLDIISPVARALLPLVGAELWFADEPAPSGTPERLRQDALGLLAEWDGSMSEHLPEPLIYAAWMAELQRRLIRDELGPVADEVTQLHPGFIDRVFRNTGGAGAWCDVIQSAPVETCAMIARQALDAALQDLSTRFGPAVASWRWGAVHEARHVHPALGRAPGLGFIVNLRQPVSGGDATMAASPPLGRGPQRWSAVTGAGYRGVYDMADPDSSVFVTSTGQSGHPLSRHYDDLSALWRRGEYITMSLDPDLARAAAEGVTHLRPQDGAAGN
ncbi:penicillin acylase family protein [Paracoccus suum]|uniref:Penicillin acylase family protein n=1 Tax=Paracoccus suum TaxID=2259340 RepID=A0A344PKP8_9RHOB|nr:penicillin acylase family protein [Paracoccus suum]AXC49953.1 penicillin acylase family protein [Paracoccus suum]